MRITNKNGRIINNINDWRDAFIEVDRLEHWREGRSAYSLGDYFSNPDTSQSEGINKIISLLELLGIQGVHLTHAEIEHESRFDQYRGSGRMQDMTIWANSDNGPLVIEIEAKVDETFNVNLQEAYDNACNVRLKKPNSRAVDRIENLLDKIYGNVSVNNYKNIRYQLLYYLYGSVKDAQKIAGTAILPVMVFHTIDYNEAIGEQNKKDFLLFMDSIGFKTTIVDGVYVFKGKIENTNVYSAYIEIVY